MDKQPVIAFSGDIIQLDGTSRTGVVLEWKDQLAINQREMAATHFPVRPLSNSDSETLFWPIAGVTIVKRLVIPRSPRLDEFEYRP